MYTDEELLELYEVIRISKESADDRLFRMAKHLEEAISKVNGDVLNSASLYKVVEQIRNIIMTAKKYLLGGSRSIMRRLIATNHMYIKQL
jgi:hypothetical protein